MLLTLAFAQMAIVRPASAEPRWLACTYADTSGKQASLAVMFDQDRNISSIFEDGQMVEGVNTSITFQAIRSRFPNFFLTYNRNDGALSLALVGGGGFTRGIVNGTCRRANPPPGAPRG